MYNVYDYWLLIKNIIINKYKYYSSLMKRR